MTNRLLRPEIFIGAAAAIGTFIGALVSTFIGNPLYCETIGATAGTIIGAIIYYKCFLKDEPNH